MLTPVEKLLAIEEIKLLKARYFRFVDSHDWTRFRELFADDAEFAAPTPPPGTTKFPSRDNLRGADAFVAYVKEAKEGANGSRSVHKGYMPEIEILSADEATGIWGMEDVIHAPNRKMNGHGYYRESYVRRDGKWRISKMALFYKSMEVTEMSMTNTAVV
jgi:hypothetical protein